MGIQKIASRTSTIGTINTTVPVKEAVHWATTGSLPAVTYNNGVSGVGATLTGDVNGVIPDQDGVTPDDGDRGIIQNQVSGLENGIYEVTTKGSAGTKFVLTRAKDADENLEILDNVRVSVISGDIYKKTDLILDSNGPFTVGVSALNFISATESVAILGVKSTGTGVFDMLIANSEDLTADRSFTIELNDGDRTLDLATDVALDQNLLTTSNVTFNSVTATVNLIADNIDERQAGVGVAIDGIIAKDATIIFDSAVNTTFISDSNSDAIIGSPSAHGLYFGAGENSTLDGFEKSFISLDETFGNIGFDFSSINFEQNKISLDITKNAGVNASRAMTIENNATVVELSFFGVTAVAQASLISDPSGGATVDAEARTAINALIDVLSGSSGGNGLMV